MADVEPLQSSARIQEAHGLWELLVARLAAFVESGARPDQIAEASSAERAAFRNWQDVSKACGA